MRRQPTRRQGGFTLLEVLIAALVLAIGLLGLASLYAVGLKSADSANQRTKATLLAEDIFERMRANRDAALGGDYDVANLSASPSGEGVVVQDFNEWKLLLQREFAAPDASSIDCDTNTEVCTVTISLADTRGEVGGDRLDGDTGDFILNFVFRTRL
jgi:type IV pilus assembly protein PilV